MYTRQDGQFAQVGACDGELRVSEQEFLQLISLLHHEIFDGCFEGCLILYCSFRDRFPVNQILVEQGQKKLVINATDTADVFVEAVV